MKVRTTHFAMPLMLILGILCLVMPGACQSFIDATGVSAAAAGKAGIIDQDFADAIVKSGEQMRTALEEITPEQEYYIGRAVGTVVLTRYAIDSSRPVLTSYLNKILAALVINIPLDPQEGYHDVYNGYHAVILDSDEINAFATSGGHIFVTRGLVNSAGSEDALAAALAHEVAHIQLQHGIKAIKTDRILRALRYTGASITGAITEGTSLEELTDIFDESITDIVTTMFNSGYSRDQEFRADALALTLLAAAGYDPQSLPDMLRSLDENQPKFPGGFNDTHPAPKDRITNAVRRLGSKSVPDTRAYRRARFSAALK
ncbi:MAG: M48 family metallopeptidase [Treponema sp.]|jgi:predicted Zn-dependent protease|nr:M48 family metallopeptidase [Treponema sp.]